MKQAAVCLAILIATFLPTNPATAGELQNRWVQQQKSPADAPKSHDKTPPSETPKVTEIGIEHTLCYGPCPVYTLILKSDGTFTYHGELHVSKKGDLTGKLADNQFEKLAKTAIEIGFMDLETNYSKPVTDHSSIFTMVVVGGQRKIIRDYAATAPEKLRKFEKQIDDALGDATWDKPAKNPADKQAGSEKH